MTRGPRWLVGRIGGSDGELEQARLGERTGRPYGLGLASEEVVRLPDVSRRGRHDRSAAPHVGVDLDRVPLLLRVGRADAMSLFWALYAVFAALYGAFLFTMLVESTAEIREEARLRRSRKPDRSFILEATVFLFTWAYLLFFAAVGGAFFPITPAVNVWFMSRKETKS